MIYQIEKIRQDVRRALDENSDDRSFLGEGDLDTLGLDELIESKVEEAVRRVVMEAPVHLLSGGVPFGDAVYWVENKQPFKDSYAGWIILPDDFMRLFVFRMSDWERPVYEVLTAGDPRYELQFSRYPGIRGNPQKPVVAIVSRAEGLTLEFFCCKSKDVTVAQALYFALPRIDCDGGIEIPERCYTSVIYASSALVLGTLGNMELAKFMDELSKHYLS